MSKWNKQEGDAISAGDIVCEIETDKAVVDYEATDDMFLAKILIPAGTENIPIGQPMMVVVEEQESIAAFKDFKLEETPAASTDSVASEKPIKKETAPEPAAPQPSPKVSPPTKQTEAEPAVSAASTAKPSSEAATPTPAAPTLFEEKWGFGIKKSAISSSLIKKQQAYIALYGVTGMTPVTLPEKKK